MIKQADVSRVRREVVNNIGRMTFSYTDVLTKDVQMMLCS